MPFIFSYVAANAGRSNADYISAVRWLLQDTDESTAEVTDTEITAQYGQTPTDEPQSMRNCKTAVAVAVALHRRYAKQATFSSGGTSINYKERAASWETAIESLRDELRAAAQAEGYIDQGGVLYAGRETGFYDDTFYALGGFPR